MASSSGITASSLQMDYMKLLLTQLRNQNPMEPMSNGDMTMQLTQLGQLEQLTNMSTTFQGALAAAQRGQAASLIGKEVSFVPYGENGISSGRVEGVEMTGDEMYLVIGSNLQYTTDDEVASESTRVDDLDQTEGLDSGDTITVYGIKPDGTAINGGSGAQIGLSNGWDYLTLGDLMAKVTDVLAVDGEETYVAQLRDGAVTVYNKFSGETVEAFQFLYNGNGRFDMPQLARPFCSLDSIMSISE